MEQAFSAPIIQKRKSTIRIVIVYLVVIAIVTFTLGWIIKQPILLMSAAFLFIGCVMVSIFIKKHVTIGQITLTSNYIKINLFQEDEVYFQLSDIDQLKIKLFGYKGETYMAPFSLLSKDGAYNHIQFRKNNQDFSFEISLTDSNMKAIRRMYRKWKDNGIQFTVQG